MREAVLGALAEARALGFLGPGPLEAHLASAAAFARALEPGVADALDLGSGGGVPGLILAEVFPTSRWVLLDTQRRRTSFLARAVAELGWEDRVRVVRQAAQEAAHDPAYRGRFDVVTARSFGPPAITAEAAVGFLQAGGRLIVAEPPHRTSYRWPADIIGLGLALDHGVEVDGVHVARLRRCAEVPADVPRSLRRMTQRPWW